MPLLAPTTYGWVEEIDFTHSGARNATTGNSNSDEPTTTQTGFGYQMVLSGRTTIYTIRRLFISFKTSSITQSLSAASIKISGASANSKESIIVPSTAFGGANQTITNDDYNNLSFNTNYNSGLSSWANGVNTYTLNSTALSDITNNGYFIVAVIQKDNDYDNVGLTGRGGVINFSTNFGAGIKLDYTIGSGGPTNVAAVNEVLPSSIAGINNVDYANIGRINGIN